MPAGKALHFQLLDERMRCVQIMRSFTGVMPGETRGCQGCHALHTATPEVRYNALALSLSEQAMRQARDVDDDLKHDRTRGPLQGIPYGVKDLLAFAGKPTSWGATPYANQVFDYSATAIEKLSGAGAILTGKLAMVELAGGLLAART